MEQLSNVENRAKKEYSRKSFELLLREIISNALHSVLLSKEAKEPKIDIIIKIENDIKISITDNGEGFTEKNFSYFKELDSINIEKENAHYNPRGQGRLALIYFSNRASYKSIYEQGNIFYERKFHYPLLQGGLFESSDVNEANTNILSTELSIIISSHEKLRRANTFFNINYNCDLFKGWIINNFFALLIDDTHKNIEIHIEINNNKCRLDTNKIKENLEKVDFDLKSNEDDKIYKFYIWIIKIESGKTSHLDVKICSRGLLTKFNNKEALPYEISLNAKYALYLTSEYLDQRTNNTGDNVEVFEKDILLIEDNIKENLDKHFKETIEKNRDKSKLNFQNYVKNYPSLGLFIDEANISNSNLIKENKDFIKESINCSKSR
ncbi:MAG: ATP-binding protein [Candidatus Atribacteria bacterium]|nr:ATP-binding protein [Candidatus Atribacteria bacterium]